MNSRTKILKSKIESISALGKVRITFNATIEAGERICPNNTDIYVVPALFRDLEEDFNSSSVNFTWEVIEVLS